MRIIITTLACLAIIIAGCSGSGGNNPIEPGGKNQTVSSSSPSTPAHSNRQTLGLWEVEVASDHRSASLTPLRMADMHLNITKALETQPFSHCLRIVSAKAVSPDRVDIDVQIWHPFPGSPEYTVFDVRGIVITNSNFTFPSTGRSIALGSAYARLLGAEGYTSLFNPTEFSQGPDSGFFKWYQGKFATGTSLSANLNGFMAFGKDKPRRLFTSGDMLTETLQIFAPNGAFTFGYAIDASWMPAGKKVTDPEIDFPVSANCAEPYKLAIANGSGLSPDPGSSAIIQVNAWSHNGADSISSVSVEAPNLFTGQLKLDYSSTDTNGMISYRAVMTNTFGAKEGSYLILAKVDTKAVDPNLGVVSAYQVGNVFIKKGWVNTWGAKGDDSATCCAMDSEGNTYVAGTFINPVDFDPGPGIVIKEPIDGKVYLSKFDPKGSLVWVQTWGYPGNYTSLSVTSIVTDSTGSVYVGGSFDDTKDFDPGSSTDNRTAQGSQDAYVSKFNTSGHYLWVRTWGAENASCYTSNLAVDKDENLYIVGLFIGIVDFNPGPGMDMHPSAGEDAYLSSLNPLGDFRWAHTWGGSYQDRANSVTVDNSGTIYVTGLRFYSFDFDPGPGVAQSDDKEGAYLVAYNTSGDFQGFKTWSIIDPNHGYVSGIRVASGEFGRIYIMGTFQGAVDFDPDPSVDTRYESIGASFYLSIFDPSGILLGVRVWNNDNNVYNSAPTANSMTIDDFGNVYIVGYFGSQADFDPGPSTAFRTSNGKFDAFVLKLDYKGDYRWAQSWGGTARDSANDVATDPSGNVAVTGYFRYLVNFSFNNIPAWYTGNSADAFLLHIFPDGTW